MPTILDFEARSSVDLKRSGVSVYAKHYTTDVICLSYYVQEENRLGTWLPGEPLPHLPGPFIAHNASFDRSIWESVMMPRYGAKPAEAWECTSSRCAFYGLPRGL